MLRPYYGDLHVHTVLSPCASYNMLPSLIVKRACAMGLDILAVTDHNSAENAAAVVKASAGSKLRVLPGMEVETREEVHVLALFDRVEDVQHWQQVVYSHLPDLPNQESIFGVQLVVDAEDQLVRRESRRLLIATALPVQRVVEEVTRLGGICIASHVDRPSYSIIQTLGFVPPGLDLAALEVSRNVSAHEYSRGRTLAGYRVVQSSDAHDLDDLGTARTLYHLAEPTLAEIALACRGRQGRQALLIDEEEIGQSDWDTVKQALGGSGVGSCGN